MEKYNFIQDDKSGPSWFSRLMFRGDVQKLKREAPDFDSSNLTIELKIDGVEVLIKDFNEVLKDWSSYIYEDVRTRLDYYQTKEAVIEEAKKLIDDKMGIAYDVLSQIESDMWKLED